MGDWDPDIYQRFREQRQKPFVDLIDLLPPQVGGRWLDLGCGDGHNTRLAVERLGAEEVVAVDNSDAMMAKAEEGEGGNITFRRADLVDVAREPDSFDLVLSNAALHFVDDHETFFPTVLERVAPGGWIAVHLPYNHIARTHLLLDTIARSEDFERHFEGFDQVWPQERPETYARMLKNAGFQYPSVQLRTYRHPLQGVGRIVDWIRGGAARPYLEHLGEEHHDAFLAKYARLLDHAYPPVSGDLRLLDYTRLFIVGRRPA